jgi:hypothetical protein
MYFLSAKTRVNKVENIERLCIDVLSREDFVTEIT